MAVRKLEIGRPYNPIELLALAERGGAVPIIGDFSVEHDETTGEPVFVPVPGLDEVVRLASENPTVRNLLAVAKLPTERIVTGIPRANADGSVDVYFQPNRDYSDVLDYLRDLANPRTTAKAVEHLNWFAPQPPTALPALTRPDENLRIALEINAQDPNTLYQAAKNYLNDKRSPEEIGRQLSDKKFGTTIDWFDFKGAALRPAPKELVRFHELYAFSRIGIPSFDWASRLQQVSQDQQAKDSLIAEIGKTFPSIYPHPRALQQEAERLAARPLHMIHPFMAPDRGTRDDLISKMHENISNLIGALAGSVAADALDENNPDSIQQQIMNGISKFFEELSNKSVDLTDDNNIGGFINAVHDAGIAAAQGLGTPLEKYAAGFAATVTIYTTLLGRAVIQNRGSNEYGDIFLNPIYGMHAIIEGNAQGATDSNRYYWLGAMMPFYIAPAHYTASRVHSEFPTENAVQYAQSVQASVLNKAYRDVAAGAPLGGEQEVKFNLYTTNALLSDTIPLLYPRLALYIDGIWFSKPNDNDSDSKKYHLSPLHIGANAATSLFKLIGPMVGLLLRQAASGMNPQPEWLIQSTGGVGAQGDITSANVIYLSPNPFAPPRGTTKIYAPYSSQQQGFLKFLSPGFELLTRFGLPPEMRVKISIRPPEQETEEQRKIREEQEKRAGRVAAESLRRDAQNLSARYLAYDAVDGLPFYNQGNPIALRRRENGEIWGTSQVSFSSNPAENRYFVERTIIITDGDNQREYKYIELVSLYNGEKGSTTREEFYIPYIEEGKEIVFYPSYIIAVVPSQDNRLKVSIFKRSIKIRREAGNIQDGGNIHVQHFIRKEMELAQENGGTAYLDDVNLNSRTADILRALAGLIAKNPGVAMKISEESHVLAFRSDGSQIGAAALPVTIMIPRRVSGNRFSITEDLRETGTEDLRETGAFGWLEIIKSLLGMYGFPMHAEAAFLPFGYEIRPDEMKIQVARSLDKIKKPVPSFLVHSEYTTIEGEEKDLTTLPNTVLLFRANHEYISFMDRNLTVAAPGNTSSAGARVQVGGQSQAGVQSHQQPVQAQGQGAQGGVQGQGGAEAPSARAATQEPIGAGEEEERRSAAGNVEPEPVDMTEGAVPIHEAFQESLPEPVAEQPAEPVLTEEPGGEPVQPAQAIRELSPMQLAELIGNLITGRYVPSSIDEIDAVIAALNESRFAPQVIEAARARLLNLREELERQAAAEAAKREQEELMKAERLLADILGLTMESAGGTVGVEPGEAVVAPETGATTAGQTEAAQEEASAARQQEEQQQQQQPEQERTTRRRRTRTDTTSRSNPFQI